MEQVTVRISKKDGVMKFETNGFQGEGCNVIEQIEMSLGTVTKHEDTDERYQYELHTPAMQGTSS